LSETDVILLYGRPGCPMVPPVRALLDGAGVEYTYLDIRKDSDAGVRLRQLTGGFESVPTVVLPGGQVLVEPGVVALRRALAEMGIGNQPSAGSTLKAGLMNPIYVILALIAVGLVIAAVVFD